MAAFNFPSSPNNGQSYTANGVTFTYSSASGAWQRSSAVGAQGAAGAQGATGSTGAQGALATINGNTDHYVVTATGTANTLQGESTLTFDGTTLTTNGSGGINISSSLSLIHISEPTRPY